MNKSSALKLIINSAKTYNINLLNNNYLFIADNGLYLEVYFKDVHFKHLTGVETYLSPSKFYKNALDSKLTEKDIDFKKNGTTQIKLNILESMLNIQKSSKIMGVYSKNNITNMLLSTEKLVGNINYCMGFVKSDNSPYYVPNTVLKDDIRNITVTKNRILCIFKKLQKEKIYDEISYIAKEVDIQKINLLKEIKDKINPVIFEKEKTESIDNIQENSINKICINTDNINNLNIEDERIR